MRPDEELAAILRLALKGKPVERFTRDELDRKGHWQWDRGNLLEAAVLFDAAADRADIESAHDASAIGRAFNSRVRAAVLFSMSGDEDRARPVLLAATTFDWRGAGIWEDRHFMEWAFVELLEIAARQGDRGAFAAEFWRAVKWGEANEYAFPTIHPKQERLLDLCASLGMGEELRRVVDQINARTSVPRALRHRIAEVLSRSGDDSANTS